MNRMSGLKDMNQSLAGFWSLQIGYYIHRSAKKISQMSLQIGYYMHSAKKISQIL